MDWMWVPFVCCLLMAAWMFVHRDPFRHIPPGAGYRSPVDGVVASVRRVEGKGHVRLAVQKRSVDVPLDGFKDVTHLVMLRRRFLDVSVQRSPIPGVARLRQHAKSGLVSLVISSPDKRVCELVFFAHARMFLQDGEEVVQGQSLSRSWGPVGLLLPASLVHVQVRERVRAGQSEIAR